MGTYSTYILDSVLQRKKEQRELLRKDVLCKLFSILEELSHSISFDEVYIFGSITKEYSFSEGSDIDIAFLGLSDEDFFKAMSFISSRIGYDVDIVQLENHRLKTIIMSEGLQWKKNG
ncbi:MAG: hypothetical protein WBK20_15370 [Spirochaetota bacterium]